MFNPSNVDHSHEPKISYYDESASVGHMPSLWDGPNPNTVKVAVFRMLDGTLLITDDEAALSYASDRLGGDA